MRPIAHAIFPFESRRIEIDGLEMRYVDEGKGPPVLMVHGNGTWGVAYRHLVSGLKDRYRCVVPDLIGMGLSEKPGDDRYDYTLSRRVDDLDALAHKLGLRDITLVGHDWGGMVAMAFAARRPHLVRRFVMMNTVAFINPPHLPLPFVVRIMRGPLGTPLVRGLNAIARGLVHRGFAGPIAPEIRAAYLAPYDSWGNRIATHRFVQDIPLREGDRAWITIRHTEDKLEELGRRPSLVCWGMRDFLIQEGYLREWIRRWPEAELQRFEKAGHFLLEDAPEQVVGAVRDFLERTDVIDESAAAPFEAPRRTSAA